MDRCVPWNRLDRSDFVRSSRLGWRHAKLPTLSGSRCASRSNRPRIPASNSCAPSCCAFQSLPIRLGLKTTAGALPPQEAEFRMFEKTGGEVQLFSWAATLASGAGYFFFSTGLIHRSRENLPKPSSALINVAPCSMARAASQASLMSFPVRPSSITSSLKIDS